MKSRLIFFLTAVNGALIVTALSALAFSMFYKELLPDHWTNSLLILIPFIITFLGAWYLKHLISYLIAGGLAASLVFMLPLPFPDRVILLVLSILLILVRIPPRISGQEGILDIPGTAGAVFFAVLFILAVILKNGLLQNILYWLGFAYVILLLVYINSWHMKEFMNERSETVNLPAGLIRKTNKRMMTIFLGVTIFMMLLIPLLPADRIVSALGDAVRAFFRWLSSFFPEAEDVAETVAQGVGPEHGEEMMLPEAAPTPAWLKFIQELLFRIFSTATIGLVIFGIGCAIVRVFRLFYRPRAALLVRDGTGDEKEMLDLTAKDAPSGRRESFFERFKPNAWVRRHYRKALLKSLAQSGTKAESMPESGTPDELERFSGFAKNDSASVVHDLYERARYSKTGCTSEDVSRLRNL